MIENLNLEGCVRFRPEGRHTLDNNLPHSRLNWADLRECRLFLARFARNCSLSFGQKGGAVLAYCFRKAQDIRSKHIFVPN
jgi:hypothetical protein